jgi:hypothetical protein
MKHDYITAYLLAEKNEKVKDAKRFIRKNRLVEAKQKQRLYKQVPLPSVSMASLGIDRVV